MGDAACALNSVNVSFESEATTPALQRGFRLREVSQGGCPGLICPHAVGVQNAGNRKNCSPFHG